VQVVVEERAVLAHGDVQRLFASVSEWRMADVMHQGERLDQINVQTQLSGDGSRDLRDLDGVGQAIAKVVRVAAGEDLSLSLEAAESSGMDYAIAVTLKVIAVGMVRLGITASAGLLHPHGVVGEHGESLTEAALRTQQSAFSTMPLEVRGATGIPGWLNAVC